MTNSRKYQRAWHKDHPGAQSVYCRRWYLKNKKRNKKRSTIWRLKNRKRSNAISRAWQLRNAEQVKARYSAWARKNKKRRREYERLWRKKNPVKLQAKLARYHARRNGAEGTFTTSEWVNLKKKYKHRCAKCHKRRKLTIDHKVPVSRGGSNYIRNIQPLCRSCNSGKKDRAA